MTARCFYVQVCDGLLVHSVHAGVTSVGRKAHLSITTAAEELAEELVKMSEQEARRCHVNFSVIVRESMTYY